MRIQAFPALSNTKATTLTRTSQRSEQFARFMPEVTRLICRLGGTSHRITSHLNVLAIFFDDDISSPLLDCYHLNEMEVGREPLGENTRSKFQLDTHTQCRNYHIPDLFSIAKRRRYG